MIFLRRRHPLPPITELLYRELFLLLKTMKTTLIVLVFVAIASAFFWLLDLFLAMVTRFFTGS